MENIIKKAGSWLFLIGICVALLVGLVFGIGQTTNTNLTNLETPLGIIVAVLGFIVGILSFFALGAVTQEKAYVLNRIINLNWPSNSSVINNMDFRKFP